MERAYTPLRLLANKPIIEHKTRSPSPESIFKVQSTVQMYSQIKRSLTPIKTLPSLPELPKKKKILLFSEEITRISLKEHGIGDEYAKAFSNTVKDLNNLQELNVRNNRIADPGASSILNSLKDSNLKILDLSSNPIGKKTIQSLVEILENTKTKLLKLSLENTKIGLIGFEQIVTALRYNHSLQELNLANNKLGVGCGKLLKELLTVTNTLKKIDLHWNFIRNYESVLFFEGLSNNDTLVAVDISWNSLGLDTETTSALCNFLLQNTQLSHFDISNNRISYKNCQEISEAVKSNHNLIGLHIEGNNCRIDHMGFIFPMGEVKVPEAMQKSARILRSPRRINDNNCWICNDYVDFHVQWNPQAIQWNRKLKNIANLAFRRKSESVFLHLDIDEYNPFILQPDSNGIYSVTRAVPRDKKIKFFFSYRGFAQISHEYQIEPLMNPITKLLVIDTGESREITAGVINFACVVKGENTCKARPFVEKYKMESHESSLIESEWSFENSIFSAYKIDSEVLFI